MPNWGAEIPVTIVDRKPDFVGDDDVCAIYQRDYWLDHNKAGYWGWHKGITAIKLIADHRYYTKEKPMVISREAAIEALKRLAMGCNDQQLADIINGVYSFSSVCELAKAIQELWDACPEKRPVDNRVIAMRHAWVVDNTFSRAQENNIREGGRDDLMKRALATFDAKLAELEAGSE